jgi:predicted permease
VLTHFAGNVGLILPMFLPIVVGLLLRRTEFLPPAFWPQAERLTYYVLLPALIAEAIATSRLGELEPGRTVLVLCSGLLAVTGVLYALKALLRIEGPAFASLYHSCVRPNGYMGIATALALLGPAARPHVSLVVALWVPLGLVLATAVFLRESAGAAVTARGLLDRLLRNPLIASVAAGLLLNALGAGPLLREVALLDGIGRAAVAIGLLAVGAGLDLGSLRASGRALYAAVLLGLLAKPALLAGIALGAGLDRTAGAVLVVFAAVSTSPSGYVLASQMRADAPLMAAIIAFQTAFSVVTLAAVAAALV